MSCAEMSELYNATRRVTGLRRNAAGDDDVMTPRIANSFYSPLYALMRYLLILRVSRCYGCVSGCDTI